MTNFLTKNLNNLHEFWSLMPYTLNEGVYHHISWPNKVWNANLGIENHPQPNHERFATAQELSENCLQSLAMQISNQLIAMYLDLADAKSSESQTVEILTQENQLSDWALSCSEAFGYSIATDPLKQLFANKNVNFFIFKVQGQIAGTAIAFKTEDTMGIHQVGVLPSFQGQGIGKKLMMHLIEYAKIKQCKYVTLQASQAGLSIYKKLGFKEIGSVYHLSR